MKGTSSGSSSSEEDCEEQPTSQRRVRNLNSCKYSLAESDNEAEQASDTDLPCLRHSKRPWRESQKVAMTELLASRAAKSKSKFVRQADPA